VIAIEVWPSISETIFGCTPRPSRIVAAVWQRSWKRIRSRPADTMLSRAYPLAERLSLEDVVASHPIDVLVREIARSRVDAGGQDVVNLTAAIITVAADFGTVIGPVPMRP
jgi:hypothetical protein